jgi:CDP-4-dehydro-6-deoxyglucose reductase, E1
MQIFSWPLMANNITSKDLEALIAFLQKTPRLTQSDQVRRFERRWSEWLGVRHSVFVNSGSSANYLTLAVLKLLSGDGEVILSPLNWISDIGATLNAGFTPVFVDVHPANLCADTEKILAALTPRTIAVLMTHIQGFNGLTQRLMDALDARNIVLIEDVCESHGATYKGRKLGSFGRMSNFSFYYAHHLSTVEGGMVCTDDDEVYEILRMMRSHGMVRESANPQTVRRYQLQFPDLSPDFIFAHPGYNFRNTEMGAVLGLSQLEQLDHNNLVRQQNFKRFITQLDANKFRTDFDLEGSCNYAFNLILRHADDGLRDRVEAAFSELGVEFRRGSSGGGNQLRQPYLKTDFPDHFYTKFPHVEHIHFYAWYIGNYPSLDPSTIDQLCQTLNRL